MGIDLGVKSTGGKYTATWADSDWDASGKESETLGGDYEFVGGLDINYGFALGSDMILRVGATYDVNDTDIYSFSESYSDTWGSYRDRTTFEESDHFSVYVAPGLLIGERTLAYVKLAHHRMKVTGKNSWSQHDIDGVLVAGTSIKGSEKFEGWGFGAGIETQLSEKIFFTADVQYVRYNSETILSESAGSWSSEGKVRPTSAMGTLGLSYRF